MPVNGGFGVKFEGSRKEAEAPFDGVKPGERHERLSLPRTKKADVAEHPKVFDHVGLLVNESPGMPELLFTKSSDHC